jgi:cell division protein FtsB
MTEFCVMVKKQKEIESLKKENEILKQTIKEVVSQLNDRGGFEIVIKGIESKLNK